MSYGYIYEITNNINGKKYVGKRVGFKDVETYMGSGTRLKRAQKKYGIENFSKRILNEYDTRAELNDAEKYFIAVYRHFYGNEMMYNISPGGEGGAVWGYKENHPFYGKHHSEEWKKHHSEAMKGKQTGENHPFYGKHHSEETKKKWSKARTGEKNYNARKVNQYDLQGNFLRTWNYISEVENELGIAHQSISACCRGKYKSAGGFIWRYVEEL